MYTTIEKELNQKSEMTRRIPKHAIKVLIIVCLLAVIIFHFSLQIKEKHIERTGEEHTERIRKEHAGRKTEEHTEIITEKHLENLEILNPNSPIYCLALESSNSLPVISQTEIRYGKSIFFHETSCRSYENGKITILARQACSVEAAARLHPEMDVYLLFSSPSSFHFNNSESDDFLLTLLNYTNVKILHVDHMNYFRGTIVEQFYLNRKIETSKYAISHFSDLIRMLTINKYGGIYLDLDVIVQKSFDDLAENFLAMENTSGFGSSVFRFSADELGKKMTKAFLEELADTYDPAKWGFNGPLLIGRVVTKFCNLTEEQIAKKGECNGLKVYNSSEFFKIPWQDKDKFFDTKYNDEVLNAVKDSHAVHVWNFLSSKVVLNTTSNVPYSILAKSYCPKVFSKIKNNF